MFASFIFEDMTFSDTFCMVHVTITNAFLLDIFNAQIKVENSQVQQIHMKKKYYLKEMGWTYQ